MPAPPSCRRPGVLVLAAALTLALSLIAGAQSAGRGAIQTPTGGRGPGAAPDANDPANANADLSPKPPVVPLTPAEQAMRFWLPAGYRMEPVLADPIIEDPAQIAFDGNGRMFVVELRGYFQTPEGIDLIPPIGRISMHEDRDNDGIYEHHTVFVDKMVFPRFVTAVRRQHHSDDGDERGRGVEVHGHQRRRRGRQERAVHDQLRARRQHGVAAGQPVLGDGQLALQHGERVPPAMDAERPPEGTDRAEQLAVGRDPGQRRQGLVPGRRQRAARILPVPGALRQLRAAGSVRAGPEHRVGRADPHRRHPGRACRARACPMAR